MRLPHAVLIVLLIAPVSAAAQGNLGTHEDRIAVEDVMARYVWTVDSLDADGYAAVFTDDAVIDANGTISRGREEIRKVVTSLIQRRDDNKAKGLPTANLYHVISNVRITFPKPGEALHQSYWQTVRRDKDGRMIAAAMGRSEDRLVKRNGQWLIQSRRLTVFTDRAPDGPATPIGGLITQLSDPATAWTPGSRRQPSCSPSVMNRRGVRAPHLLDVNPGGFPCASKRRVRHRNSLSTCSPQSGDFAKRGLGRG